jgi:ribosomal protein L17
VERLITIAKRSLSAAEGSIHHVNARRAVTRDIPNREVVSTLFETIAPRYVERHGGYTRLLRLGYRRGDSAERAQIELLGSEYDPSADIEKDKKTAEGAPEKPKPTMGGRIRQALGGRKKDDNVSAKVDKRAKGAPKSTTPRKAGGS